MCPKRHFLRKYLGFGLSGVTHEMYHFCYFMELVENYMILVPCQQYSLFYTSQCDWAFERPD